MYPEFFYKRKRFTVDHPCSYCRVKLVYSCVSLLKDESDLQICFVFPGKMHARAILGALRMKLLWNLLKIVQR